MRTSIVLAPWLLAGLALASPAAPPAATPERTAEPPSAGAAQRALDECAGSWQWASPLPTGADFTAVVHAPGIGFVAVGRGGAAVTSQDGLAWTARGTGTNDDLLGLAYGNGLLVAVGWRRASNSPLIVTSPDGVTWTVRDSQAQRAAATGLAAVAFDGATFVALSSDGKSWISPDGIDWPDAGTPMGGAAWFQPSGAAWTGDRFIAVGVGKISVPSVTGGIILTSRDGANWSGPYSIPQWPTSVAVGGGGIVVGGQLVLLASSDDGSTWTPANLAFPLDIADVAWTGDRFVASAQDPAMGSKLWLESSDGVTWTARDGSALPDSARIAAAAGTIVAAGGAGGLAATSDGRTWLAGSTRLDAWLSAVAWTGERFVAVGYRGEIVTSEDGTAWARQPATARGELDVAVAGGGRVLALGGLGVVGASDDGLTWQFPLTGPIADYKGAAWDGSRFVAVGGMRDPATLAPTGLTGVFATTDGLAWTRIDDGSAPPLQGIVWASSFYLGLGFSGLWTSPDAVRWSASPVSPDPRLGALLPMAAAWNGHRLVVVAHNGWCDVGCCGCCGGGALTSTDGANWTATWLARDFSALAWDGGRFVAVGECGAVSTSTDGASWTDETGYGSWGSTLRGVASSPAATVAVGLDTVLVRQYCPPSRPVRRHLSRTPH